jgi:hypothetical protein
MGRVGDLVASVTVPLATVRSQSCYFNAGTLPDGGDRGAQSPGHGLRQTAGEVVGLALADHMSTELVFDAFEMALISRRPPPGVSFQFELGQYTSADYGAFARATRVVVSVAMAGQCWDNAAAESVFATIKRALIDTSAWPTRAGLRAAIFDYIEGWCNNRRLPSSLGYLGPTDYEATIQPHADRQAARSTQSSCPPDGIRPTLREYDMVGARRRPERCVARSPSRRHRRHGDRGVGRRLETRSFTALL